ncbi:MAG: glycosyltransferase [Actinobacteria bacterium]|nr:glycosyltransferase [Actinomycetota bacterium]
MHALLIFSAIFSWALSVLALVNLRTMLRPSKSQLTEVTASVEVLIPARNESENIQTCVSSALNQLGISNLRVTVLDDASSRLAGETMGVCQIGRAIRCRLFGLY